MLYPWAVEEEEEEAASEQPQAAVLWLCIWVQKHLLDWCVEIQLTWSSEEQNLLMIFICEKKEKEHQEAIKPIIMLRDHMGIKLS